MIHFNSPWVRQTCLQTVKRTRADTTAWVTAQLTRAACFRTYPRATNLQGRPLNTHSCTYICYAEPRTTKAYASGYMDIAEHRMLTDKAQAHAHLRLRVHAKHLPKASASRNFCMSRFQHDRCWAFPVNAASQHHQRRRGHAPDPAGAGKPSSEHCSPSPHCHVLKRPARWPQKA